MLHHLFPGPYFTYLAGFGHEGESTPDPWNKVPVCITRAREFMQNLGRRSGQYEAFTVDQLTVLAWHNTGSRKVQYMNLALSTTFLTRVSTVGKSVSCARYTGRDSVSWCGC